MQLTLSKNTLLKALTQAVGVIERQNTIPILANVKLFADKTSLSLYATNLDASVTLNIDATVVDAGEVTVSGVLLFDAVKRMSGDGVVSLTVKNDALIVKYNKLRVSLDTLPVGDFPEIKSDNINLFVSLPSVDLKTAIDKTRFCMSTEETRYYLNGIYFHNEEDKIVLVAADGHRLACNKINGNGTVGNFILPRKAVDLLLKVLDSNDVVDVHVSKNIAMFVVAAKRYTLTTKLIDGTYPDYKRVIPASFANHFDVNVSDLKNAVNAVSVGNHNSNAIAFSMGGGIVSLKTKIAVDEIPLLDGYGVEFTLGFNAKYLLDILNVLTDTVVRISYNDSNSPVGVNGYILMPMRV